jgi:hypothetical protein
MRRLCAAQLGMLRETVDCWRVSPLNRLDELLALFYAAQPRYQTPTSRRKRQWYRCRRLRNGGIRSGIRAAPGRLAGVGSPDDVVGRIDDAIAVVIIIR